MKILITGGAGFIGSNLCKRLLDDKKITKIVSIDNLSTGRTILKNKKYEFYKIDISNFVSLRRIPNYNYSIVFHFAAQSSGPKSHKIFDKDFNINFLGTINILNFMKERKLKKIVFSSSMSVYGNLNKPVASETDQTIPISNYAMNKLMAENYIKYYKKFKINFVILRLFSIYGFGQDLKNKSQGMLSIYLSYILENKIILIKGSQQRFRDFLYIDDLIFILHDIIYNYKNYNLKIINIGTGKKTTVKKLIDLLKNQFEKKTHRVKVLKPTIDDQMGVIANNKKLLKILKNFKFTSLSDGISKLYKFYLND